MTEYHKIQSIFKRDQRHRFVLGDWSLPEFGILQHNQWEFTEKVDGTNIRLELQDRSVTVGGRTNKAELPGPLAEMLHQRFEQTTILQDMFPDKNVTIYGEGFGPKIQTGYLYGDKQDLVVFDVKIGQFWLLHEDVVRIAANLGLPCVPVVGCGTLHDAIKLVQAGLKSRWGNFEAEGLVVRPVGGFLRRNGDRIITKVKGKDFAALQGDLLP